jgi:hypothetical protein
LATAKTGTPPHKKNWPCRSHPVGTPINLPRSPAAQYCGSGRTTSAPMRLELVSVGLDHTKQQHRFLKRSQLADLLRSGFSLRSRLPAVYGLCISAARSPLCRAWAGVRATMRPTDALACHRGLAPLLTRPFRPCRAPASCASDAEKCDLIIHGLTSCLRLIKACDAPKSSCPGIC